MLRQVFIVKDSSIVYGRTYGKSINKDEFKLIFPQLKEQSLFQIGKDTGSFINFKYRLSYFIFGGRENDYHSTYQRRCYSNAACSYNYR